MSIPWRRIVRESYCFLRIFEKLRGYYVARFQRLDVGDGVPAGAALRSAPGYPVLGLSGPKESLFSLFASFFFYAHLRNRRAISFWLRPRRAELMLGFGMVPSGCVPLRDSDEEAIAGGLASPPKTAEESKSFFKTNRHVDHRPFRGSVPASSEGK